MAEKYKMIPRWNLGTCKQVLWVRTNDYNYLYQQNYLEDMMKIKVLATELIDMQELLGTVKVKLLKYLRTWKKYSILWDFDKDMSTTFFLKKELLVLNCDVMFSYYDNFILELTSYNEYVDLYCMRVNITQARKEILLHALKWKDILKCKLTNLANLFTSSLYERLSAIHSLLLQNIYSLDDFQNVLQAIKNFEDITCDYNTSVSLISEIQYILARHGLKYSNEDKEKQGEIQYLYAVIRKLSKYQKCLIKKSIKIYQKSSKEQIKAFTKECNHFADHYYKEGPGTVCGKLDKGYLLLQKFRKEFDAYSKKRKKMIQAEHLFQHSPHSYEQFDEALKEFHSLEIVYELYERLKEEQNQWAKIPWIYLNANELTLGIDKFLQGFNNLQYDIKILPIAQEFLKCMNNFKDSIPLMFQLKNESLKDRHWKELMSKTGHYFDLAASKFTLHDLFVMNLYQHKDTVDDIIGKADKEIQIEKSISYVKKFWSSQVLKCISLNKRYFLDDTHKVLMLLDDFCIELQRMNDTQFSQPFHHEIKKWETNLAYTREIVTEWTELQRNLLILQKIFESTLLQKELPKAYTIFDNLDKEFLKLMKNILFKSSILGQTSNPGDLNRVHIMLKDVEECKLILSTYLRTSRNHFPRLYLIKDDDLFSLIGSINSEILQSFIPKA